MKKILLLILSAVLALTIMTLASCEIVSLGPPAAGPGSSEIPDEPDTPSEPDEPDVPAEPDEPEVPVVETVKLTLWDPSTNKKVTTYTIEKGTAPSDEILSEIGETMYHGYKYVSWHYSMLFNDSNAFDSKASLSNDVTIYGNRGNLAGDNVVWNYDPNTMTLTISGDGDMFNYLYKEDVPWRQYATLTEHIVLDGELTSIGDMAFYDFVAITNVEIPETVVRIGKSAFRNSTITDINFPEPLKTIDEYAFGLCNNLTELVFNQGLIDIGHSAFYECVGITRVTLTNEIALLGFSAFYGCTNLKSAYYYGTKVEYDNLKMLLDNKALEMFANTYFISDTKPAEPGPYWRYDENGDIQQWYYTVSFYAPGEVLPFLFDYIDVKGGVTQKNIDFMNSIVYHGYKFKNFTGYKYVVGAKLTEDISLYGNRSNLCGDNLTWYISGTTLYINGEGAMWDFEYISDTPWHNRTVVNIVIGNKVTHLGKKMITDMSSLVSFEIPTNVVSIHEDAISGCKNLKYIYYLGTADQLKGVEGADRLNNLLSANVYSHSPNTSGEGYHWRDVLGGMEVTAKRVAWSIVNGVLSVGGDAALINYSDISETPWYADRDSITSVIVLDGANRVGYNSFYGMSNVNSVSIPASVMKIAESAFYGTGYYLNSANWNNGALYISSHLIKVDSAAVGNRFYIKDGTLSIAENAFSGCSQITELVFVKEILGVYKGALEPLSLEKIFFSGVSIESWEAIWLSGNNRESQMIEDVPVYCLSNNKPTNEGFFWKKIPQTDGTYLIEIWGSDESNIPDTPDAPPVDDTENN